MSEPSTASAFSCLHCASPWFGAVRFCPYCGVASSLLPVPPAIQADVPTIPPPIAQAPAVPLPAKPGPALAAEPRASSQGIAPAAAFAPRAVPAKNQAQAASRLTPKAGALLLAGLALIAAYTYWGRAPMPVETASGAPAGQPPVTQVAKASPATVASPSAGPAMPVATKPEPAFTAIQPQATQAASKSPSTQKASPIDVLQSYPIEAARQHLGEMLDAAKLGGNLHVQDQVQALAALHKPPRGDRKAALALSAQGSSALKSGNFAEAAQLLTEALRLDPSDAEVLNSLAFALLKQHQLASARNAALASLLLLPTRTATWANLAFILAEDGKLGSASSAFYLAYHFSKDKPETQNYFQRLYSEDAASTAGLKEAASGALKLINR